MGITAPTVQGTSTGKGNLSTPAASPQTLQVGSILNNKYKITKEIGSGGMGAVFLAEDSVLKRQVVIKALLSSDDPDLVAQSVKEREFLAAIKHANIVSIYDFVTIGIHGYIVMEYVYGKTLEEMMEERNSPFEVQEAIRHILGILPAFTYLAKLNLVYCDFKPQNVMVEMLKDGTEIVKLIDLGTVIKQVPNPTDVYGTHGFYAPEAVKMPSPETDLYTICRTLAYMVTQMDLANPIFGLPSSEAYKAFRDYPALYRLLAKGTHSKPSMRFKSAEELSDQLSGVLRQIAGGTPGVPVGSKLFVPGILTTTGKLGLRGEAVLDEKDTAIDLLRYGDQALRSGNYTSAAAFYQQATKTNPNSIDAHLRLAEVYIDQGEYTQALSEVTNVQRKSPGHWKVAWYTGRLLEAEGKLSAAADQYRELVADLPGELPPQQALGRVYARMGNDAVAVDWYLKVLKADPGNTDAILGVTHCLLNLQRWDDATRILSSVNEAAAKYVDAQLLLCDLYLARVKPLTITNVQQASQVMQSLAGRTEDPRYYLARGDVYHTAWQLIKKHRLPKSTAIVGVANAESRTLGKAAEESYIEYLRREHHPVNREAIVRRKLQVAPWRLW
jgi:serine/threonine-protein kinase PknG